MAGQLAVYAVVKVDRKHVALNDMKQLAIPSITSVVTRVAMAQRFTVAACETGEKGKGWSDK